MPTSGTNGAPQTRKEKRMMNKQDYIEKIANCIADSWQAADAGDQVARKAAKQGAMEIAKQAAENLGHTAGYWLAESQFRAADLY
jgi:hypothetical protein